MYEKCKKIIEESWQNYLTLPAWGRVLILLALALLLRLVAAAPLSMELDTHFFARQTDDFARALDTGTISKSTLTNTNYYGIEYRPPLYPFLTILFKWLAGTEASLVTVSLLSGVFLVIPVFLLGRKLFGDPAGDLSALIVAVSPGLVQTSVMGLSGALYVFFFTWGVYFTIRAAGDGRIADYILCGLAWGLSYLVRFEGLAAAGIAGVILAGRVIPPKDTKEPGHITPMRRGLLWGAWLLAFVLVISPYLYVIKVSSGALCLTSPAKQLYDLSEGIWIVKGEKDGYRGFNYRFGAPGEKSYKELRALTGTTPGQLYHRYRRLIIKNTIKSLPQNLWVARSNLGWFTILLSVLFFVNRRKKLSPGQLLPGWFILAALPAFLFQFWDPSPRYFAFLVPLFSLWAGGFIKDVLDDRVHPRLKKPEVAALLTWGIIPASILGSWYLESPRPFVHDFWQTMPGFISRLAPGRQVLLVTFVAMTALGLAYTVFSRKVSPGVAFAAVGTGLLSLPGILHPPAVSMNFGRFFNGYYTGAGAGLLVWVMTGALYYHLAGEPANSRGNPRLSSVLVLGLILTIPVNFHNVSLARRARVAYNYRHYNNEAAIAAGKNKSKGQPVFALHPRDAWIAQGQWHKIPPSGDVKKVREAFKNAGEGWLIINDQEMEIDRNRSLLPAVAMLKVEGQLKLAGVYPKVPPFLGMEPQNSYLFGITTAKAIKRKNRKTQLTSEKPTKKPRETQKEKTKPAGPAPWPYFRGDVHNTGRTKLLGPGSGARVDWKFHAGHEIFSSPVIDRQGRVYFGCDDSKVYCLNDRGEKLWQFVTGYYVSAPGTLDQNNRYLIGSNDQHLYCLDRTGKPAWKFKTGYYISSAPLVYDDRIYLGGEDHHLYCLNSSGKPVWKYEAADEIIGTPALSRKKNRVYFTCKDGALYCLDVSGKLQWKFAAGGQLIGSPAVGKNDIIYFGSTDRFIYGVKSTGELLWKVPTGGPVEASPAIAKNGNIYIGSKDKKVYCISPGGKILWRFSTGYAVESSPLVDGAGRIYVGSHDRNLYCINPAGREVFRVATGGAVICTPAIGPGGCLYAGSMDNNIYRIKD